MNKIIILPFAEQDIKDSVDYYKDKEEGLEIQYLNIINQAFQLISNNPLSFPLIKYKIRKFVVKEFPFNIFYLCEDSIIYILSVFHMKRDPKKWRRRII
jgi:plasmid stabilization system protein ParE